MYENLSFVAIKKLNHANSLKVDSTFWYLSVNFVKYSGKFILPIKQSAGSLIIRSYFQLFYNSIYWKVNKYWCEQKR